LVRLTPDETSLISLARKGDLDAFNQLILMYQDILFNSAFRILGGYDAAEDAVQKAFISAYRSMRDFRGGSFKSWLIRMTINACYDELRRIKRRPTVSIESKAEQNDGMDSDQWLPDRSPSPEQMSEESELQQAVQHCLHELPGDFRTIAVLADVQELNYQEISRITSVPMGTVKSRLARSRQKLRACLEGFWELLPLHLRQRYEGAG
jgi:RNA polymerase sigma-70 factor, ECF subfamily